MISFAAELLMEIAVGNLTGATRPLKPARTRNFTSDNFRCYLTRSGLTATSPVSRIPASLFRTYQMAGIGLELVVHRGLADVRKVPQAVVPSTASGGHTPTNSVIRGPIKKDTNYQTLTTSCGVCAEDCR